MIDVKVTRDHPIPVEILQLEPAIYSQDGIDAFKKRYDTEGLHHFSHYLDEEGLDSRFIKLNNKMK